MMLLRCLRTDRFVNKFEVRRPNSLVSFDIKKVIGHEEPSRPSLTATVEESKVFWVQHSSWSVQGFPRVKAVEWEEAVVCRKSVGFLRQRLPDVYQEHLDLHWCPAQAIAEGTPRKAVETGHDHVAKDVTALLKSTLLGPRPDWALVVSLLDILKPCGLKLISH